MADQITTVASLPPGYGTLAGTVYAISASAPADWNDIAWAKMGRVPRFSSLFPRLKKLPKSEIDTASGDIDIIFNLRTALSKSITKRMRPFGTFELEDILKRDIAILHVISLWSSTFESRQERLKGGDAVYQQVNSIDPESFLRSRTTVTSQISNTTPPVDSCPLPSTGSEETQSLDVRLQVIQYTGHRTSAVIHTLGIQDFENAMVSTLPAGKFDSYLGNTPISRIFNTIKSMNSTTIVLVQAAAPFNILVVEIAYKAVEVLLACAVILGSTAGAWLGLTLSSLFPRRTAAGLFVSSYGQTVRSEMGNFNSNPPYPWPPAGTVWSESEGNITYSVPPQVKLTDGWRNAIGYWIQFWLLMVYRRFKLQVRSALEFGPYVFTRDAVRYIVLALEPFIIVMSGIILHKKRPKVSVGLLPAEYSRDRNIYNHAFGFTCNCRTGSKSILESNTVSSDWRVGGYPCSCWVCCYC